MSKDEKKREDLKAILARRQSFIKAAVASAGISLAAPVACSCLQPCLQPIEDLQEEDQVDGEGEEQDTEVWVCLTLIDEDSDAEVMPCLSPPLDVEDDSDLGVCLSPPLDVEDDSDLGVCLSPPLDVEEDDAPEVCLSPVLDED